MRWVVAVVAWLASAAVLAPVCLFVVLLLAGPHSSVLPVFLQPVFFVLGWTAFLAIPVLVARAAYRRADRHRRGGAAAALLAFALAPAPLHAETVRVLSPAEVDEAIRSGWQGGTAPYELIWRSGGREEGQTVVGAVYTPFVRVAMWAHERLRQGGEYPSPADVPRVLLAPGVTIALRQEPPCCPPVDPGPPVAVRAVLVAAPGRHVLLCTESHQDAEPVPAAIDTSSLRIFDPATAERTAAVLTIPLASLRSGRDLVYELHRREAEGTKVLHFIGFGTIRDSDIASWR